MFNQFYVECHVMGTPGARAARCSFAVCPPGLGAGVVGGHAASARLSARPTPCPPPPLTAEEDSRLLLVQATALVMRQCFQLLGITPLYRI